MKIEVRSGGAVHIEGYVNAVERDSKVINVPSIGRCVEQIRAGAFENALNTAPDVAILENHDFSRRLGSVSQGNLKLYEDNIGLRAIADITDTDISEKARHGQIKGWSFGFICNEQEIEERSGNVPRRIVKGLSLSEVSLIDGNYTPCYNGTLVEVRSEGNFVEYRSGIDEKVEYNSSSDRENLIYTQLYETDSTAADENVETRSGEKIDYSYYENMLRYLELSGGSYSHSKAGKEEKRYNPYHDPGNGRFCSGGGGGGGTLVIPEGHKGVYAGYKKAMQKSLSSASDMAAERIKAMGGTVDENGKYDFSEHGGLKVNMGLTNSTPKETIDVKTGLTKSGDSATIESGKVTDKTVRNYDSGLSKAIGQARYDEVCQQIDNCPNGNLQKIYRGNINNMGVKYAPNGKECCQKNGNNSIVLNELGENTTSGRSRNSVVLHEGAHAVDNQLGGGGVDQYYSLRWNGGAFGNCLKAEVNDYINARDKKLKSEFETHRSDPKWLRENIVPAGIGFEHCPDDTIVAVFGNKKYSKSMAYKSVIREVHRNFESGDVSTSHQAGCVSDLLGLGTNNRAKNDMGHDDKYAKTGEKFALPVEAFAEFSECTALGHTDIIKSIFPKSYGMYEQILADGAAK